MGSGIIDLSVIFITPRVIIFSSQPYSYYFDVFHALRGILYLHLLSKIFGENFISCIEIIFTYLRASVYSECWKNGSCNEIEKITEI